MSTSRLEKFIYAICSMDVTDLPVPLSRIETLWNCLITGETPDFEPLSRNEKYLMAMLDRYDISNLPAPMSRGEKLLYKIAVGETDLSDVPGYLSRYEELLKYLIENGGISGGDFEYVLYTLNQSLHTLYATAEKPVKSAILKGQTLVNLINFNSIYGASNNGVKTLITKNNDGILEYTTTNTWNQTAILFEDIQFKPNTTYTIMYIPIENDGYETASKIEIRQNNNALLQTAKSKGKFSTTDNIEQITMKIGSSIASGFTIKKMKIKNVMLLEGDYTNVDIPYFEGMQSVRMPVLTTSNEDGTKTNILTVNEDITLRGIGDVKDTLDLLTGEVTESIGEIVLDGTQYMVSDGYGVYIQVNDVKRFLDYTDKIACDKLPVIPTYWELENVENGISGFTNSYSYLGQNWLYVKINNSVNKDEVKEWMTQNPITVQYQRVTDSIKTVDLTIVDQDNQPTQLGTFENVTHVSLEAENLIPEVEMEVATIISEELTSVGPLMDDISTEQQQLEATVDEQSNNVDATMIATTEIFEETL